MDNARNMDVAVREAGLAPHIKCFAHTLNLATQAGLSVPRVTRLLGRVRRVVAFFHRSPTATSVLASKQKALLNKCGNEHKPIMDVATRWNSSLDMIERHLEQQPAVAAALLSADVRRNAREIDTLDNSDIRDAEDIVSLLKSLKTATTVLSDEKTPTVSLIMPLKHMIKKSMAPNEEDFPHREHHEESHPQQSVRQVHWAVQLPAGVHCSGPQIPNLASSRGTPAPGCVPQAEGESCAAAQPGIYFTVSPFLIICLMYKRGIFSESACMIF